MYEIAASSALLAKTVNLGLDAMLGARRLSRDALRSRIDDWCPSPIDYKVKVKNGKLYFKIKIKVKKVRQSARRGTLGNPT